jgi:polysaccharide export outer membrane protein
MQYSLEYGAPQPFERSFGLEAIDESQVSKGNESPSSMGSSSMYKRVLFLLAVSCSLLISNTAFAQGLASPSAINASTGSATDTGNSPKGQYLIGVGDVLDIRIYNRPLLSRDSVRVDGRNMIRLPLVGEVRAGCLTESSLAEEISRHYLEYLKNPNVEVFIKEFQSKPVMVIGAVKEPGQFQMRRQVRLLELISLAGGLTDTANGRMQVKHSLDVPACSAESGGADTADATPRPEVEWFDVGMLLKVGADAESAPFVRPGDTVNLLDADKIFTVGNVVRPSVIPLKEKVTISKAIAASGGTLPDSRLEKVRILRQAGPNSDEKSEILVDLKAINRREAEDVLLLANDIVDVPASSGKQFVRGLMNSIGPTISRGAVRVIP